MYNFFVGTSGWSYGHWKKIFYPEKMKSSNYLEHYATFFQAVELNSSFYRLPSAHAVKGWEEKTPENFYFCPKLSRLMTHTKRLKNCDELLKGFMDIFKPLQKKMGPILIQLPSYVRFSEDITPFFFLVRESYGSYLFSLEARHKSWMEESVLKLLSEFGIGWVIADSGRRYPTIRAATAKHVYFRFHGPESLYASNYSADQLKLYAADAKNALKEGRDVWAFFNNDFMGYAIQNALLFQELVLSEK